jgi:hypothetical protein
MAHYDGSKLLPASLTRYEVKVAVLHMVRLLPSILQNTEYHVVERLGHLGGLNCCRCDVTGPGNFEPAAPPDGLPVGAVAGSHTSPKYTGHGQAVSST